jgi:hypothetical protein
VAVHNAILDDLVYPAEIVGKRIRIRLDGSRLFKIHLDKSQQTNIEHKVIKLSFDFLASLSRALIDLNELGIWDT